MENKQKLDFTDPEETTKQDSRALLYVIGIFSVVIVAALVIYFTLFNKTDYEEGMDYLKNRDYPSAIYEFQSVKPADKDFDMAQSKLNYVQGMQAFNRGDFDASEKYLLQVNNRDEYYNEVRLMLDKIKSDREAKNQAQLEAMKLQEEARLESERALKDSVENTSQAMLVVKAFDKYEEIFQSIRATDTANVNTGIKLLTSLREDFADIKSNAAVPSEILNEFRVSVNAYMSSRIVYLRNIITGSSSGDAEAVKKTTELKTNSDKSYQTAKAIADKVRAMYNIPEPKK